MNYDRTANILGALALGIADQIRAASERQASEGGPAPAAVALIGHDPGLSIDRLRRALGLSHPGAVRLVDRLVANGLVLRRPSIEDGRAVALVLTEEGLRQRDAILAERHAGLTAALTCLASEERAQLDSLVAKLLGGFVRDAGHAYAVCRLCDERTCQDCPVEEALQDRAS
ncbi:MAG TPA: MarR family transcriptional regulator [Geminicoccus sp.]|jgi:DNA-binding MarR family transcriptional regulator|uniref:MarR family winged helix-turn-helix transcriptional regulator n=1 Tax=Geminicoccus sp. TaxID=2024832 RepID=UPI002E2FE876|nr:MarR family transcriptional regulator [Geminicoccus sp.]HEX2526604.1 MarR family transcriptional regulator [Geminicoccus sp.]